VWMIYVSAPTPGSATSASKRVVKMRARKEDSEYSGNRPVARMCARKEEHTKNMPEI
jgi:hypothetical protein